MASVPAAPATAPFTSPRTPAVSPMTAPGRVRVVKAKTMITIGGLAAGAGGAYVTDRLVRKVVPEKLHLATASAGLVTAALIYPAFRRRPHKGLAARVEWLAVGATLGTGAATARLAPAERQRAVAA